MTLVAYYWPSFALKGNSRGEKCTILLMDLYSNIKTLLAGKSNIYKIKKEIKSLQVYRLTVRNNNYSFNDLQFLYMCLSKKYFGKLSELDEETAVPYIVITFTLYLVLGVNASRCVRLREVERYHSQARNAVIIEVLKKSDFYELIKAGDSV